MPSSADAAMSKTEKPRAGAPDVAMPPALKTGVEPAFAWSVAMVAGTDVGSLARERVRSALMDGRWQGNVDKATRVAKQLVDNAANHGEFFPDGTITLRLIVDAETRELLIEVEDARHDFPGFAEAANQSGSVVGRPKGLWWVAHYKGRLSWDVKKGDDGEAVGKTVQVVLPVS